METPICGIHGTQMTWKAPGVSTKTGKPYRGFWSCGQKDEQGNFCAYKPEQKPVSQAKPVQTAKPVNVDWDSVGMAKAATALIQSYIQVGKTPSQVNGELDLWLAKIREIQKGKIEQQNSNIPPFYDNEPMPEY